MGTPMRLCVRGASSNGQGETYRGACQLLTVRRPQRLNRTIAGRDIPRNDW
jgi:hypothetical protein